MRASRIFLWAALACFLVGIAPFVSVLLAGWIANAHGCQLDEGSVHPCTVLGSDWGETLYAMGVMGWFMLLSIWPLLLSPLLLIAGLLTRRAARQKLTPPRQRPRAEPSAGRLGRGRGHHG